jgi:hypothetical protein
VCNLPAMSSPSAEREPAGRAVPWFGAGGGGVGGLAR